MAEMGWIGLRLPEERGGVGLGLREGLALQEELGRGLVPEPLVAGGLAAAMLACTTEEGLLAAVLAGERIVALAWQGGPDALRPSGDPGRPLLFVPLAHAAGHVLFPVERDGALCLALAAAAEVEVVGQAQQDGSTLCTVRVPAGVGRIVSGDVREPLAAALDEAALLTAGFLLGVAERAFAITLDHLKGRRQFGQPLAAFQALQHRAADMKIQLTLSRASIEGAGEEVEAGAGPARRAAVVSRAKARAADTAVLVGREAIQMHGAIGWADECDVGLFTRKALVVANQFGSAMAHRARFARLREDGGS